MGKDNNKVFILHIGATVAILATVIYCAVVAGKSGLANIIAHIAVSGGLAVSLSVVFATVHSLRKKQRVLKKMETFVPGGYIECFLDDTLTIKYCNDKLISYLGFSEEEFLSVTEGSMLSIVAPEDKEVIKVGYSLCSDRKKHDFRETITLIGKDNIRKRVVFIFGCVRQPNCLNLKRFIAQNYIIDEDALRRLESGRDIDSERYKIVAEQSESMIFDYNIKDGYLFTNSNLIKKFGITGGSYKKDFIINGLDIVYEEDKEVFSSLDWGKAYGEFEARLKNVDGEYIWCKVRSTIIKDDRGEPLRAIGKVIDVDKSRREKQQLIEKSRRDVMTGLYNKQATEALITEELLGAPENAIFAFIMFDVDNFKSINDKFGHLCGDKVLFQLAKNIKMTFRSSDIIGRIGGDEFVIFIKDLRGEEHAIRKAEAVLSIIEEQSNLEKDGFHLSASIGISFFSKD